MIAREPRALRAAWSTSLVLGAVLGSTCPATASPTGPPDGFAGNPPMSITCRDCHGYAVGDGNLALLGLPPVFTPGTSYDLTVELQDPGQRRWGFELTVIDAPSHAAGTLAVVDSIRTQLSDHPGSEPDYLKQTLDGTQNGTLNGVTWSVRWIAPAEPVTATFYLAGNAANGNNQNTGDFIYSIAVPIGATTAIADAPAPVVLAIGASYPEPFAAAAWVPYGLLAPARVEARIVDPMGRIVARLGGGEMPAGRHLLRWDGRNAAGEEAPAGVYQLLITAGAERATETLLRLNSE